jgi:hypothetical protein
MLCDIIPRGLLATIGRCSFLSVQKMKHTSKKIIEGQEYNSSNGVCANQKKILVEVTNLTPNRLLWKGQADVALSRNYRRNYPTGGTGGVNDVMLSGEPADSHACSIHTWSNAKQKCHTRKLKLTQFLMTTLRWQNVRLRLSRTMRMPSSGTGEAWSIQATLVPTSFQIWAVIPFVCWQC